MKRTESTERDRFEVEYGGEIVQKSENEFHFTGPRRGKESSVVVYADTPGCVAIFHSHPTKRIGELKVPAQFSGAPARWTRDRRSGRLECVGTREVSDISIACRSRMSGVLLSADNKILHFNPFDRAYPAGQIIGSVVGGEKPKNKK